MTDVELTDLFWVLVELVRQVPSDPPVHETLVKAAMLVVRNQPVEAKPWWCGMPVHAETLAARLRVMMAYRQAERVADELFAS